jgi:excisionase family DNA binding protein
MMKERVDLTLFSLKETAALLGVSKSTIRRAVDRGDLEVVRLTEKLVRVPSASVEKWIAESAETAATS